MNPPNSDHYRRLVRTVGEPWFSVSVFLPFFLSRTEERAVNRMEPEFSLVKKNLKYT